MDLRQSFYDTNQSWVRSSADLLNVESLDRFIAAVRLKHAEQMRLYQATPCRRVRGESAEQQEQRSKSTQSLLVLTPVLRLAMAQRQMLNTSPRRLDATRLAEFLLCKVLRACNKTLYEPVSSNTQSKCWAVERSQTPYQAAVAELLLKEHSDLFIPLPASYGAQNASLMEQMATVEEAHRRAQLDALRRKILEANILNKQEMELLKRHL